MASVRIRAPRVVSACAAAAGRRRVRGAASLAVTLEALDAEIAGHGRRVARLAAATAPAVGLPRGEVRRLELAARVHDVGKLLLPREVLLKRGALTADEWALVERHPVVAAHVLAALREPRIARWVLHHHERWDGSGYPGELAAQAIPLPARIIAVADAYDAMRSDRGYRPRVDHAAAMAELDRCAGTQFDPQVVRAFARAAAAIAASRAG